MLADMNKLIFAMTFNINISNTLNLVQFTCVTTLCHFMVVEHVFDNPIMSRIADNVSLMLDGLLLKVIAQDHI